MQVSPSQHIPVHFADLYIPELLHMLLVQALHLSACRDLRKNTHNQEHAKSVHSQFIYVCVSGILQ